MSSDDIGSESRAAPMAAPVHGGGAGPAMSAAAEVFKAVAHPVRAQILELLSHGESSIPELCEGTGVKATHLARHLTQLRGQQLIQRLWSGGRLVYRLTNPEAAGLLAAARSVLQARTASADGALRPAPEELPDPAWLDEQLSKLESLLASRSVIAEARTAIAERSGCTPEEAAAELFRTARTRGVTLLEAARDELGNGQEQRHT
ncbi:metalloregulator ArsR/SmtB family transcription factor [Arthrobacter sp. Cr_A7]|uniref:metalloregulator ArsR/SmtB family transcription factor n=1 Tax=Arthrobacter sp. Cr_A7 TaxID=3031017 RepID=UPI0023DB4AC0|nr:metalloregulator ArsR/SmtB family transcription factor [Arthrobacter sp. Cr_A7]MDF2048424.1 metalloregulator ArsR/SmtB family transcription factor [Arthrobacter sp. Cr_A7]